MFSIDWPLVGHHLGRMLLAFALAFPLGWERGRGRDSPGFRTFPIVSMASCGYALLATRLVGADAESMTRLLQGLVAGIGFIGGGAIVKQRGQVQGLVTAASIWTTGAIGVSVAYGRIEIAVALSVVNFLSLLVLTPIANRSQDDPSDRG
ncbi:MgtC/SapB family protein [Caulobacter sp. NIBR1757]|uniref:MgtC/SapB family protein n=1 Tax=Caulobacter sp. NIBR1757 TaxID=3016000 RepID=UPI0022F082E4|nr:MgtC/SapB family protein [Caulobacter sp. NIBR1757]WGM38584.1 Protein SrpB [Caulobacter sp. NIBR1757]